MTVFDFATTDRLAQLAPLLGLAVLKSTLVLLVGAACALAARKASAAGRHLIWTLTLGGALAVPAVSAIVPAWYVPLLGTGALGSSLFARPVESSVGSAVAAPTVVVAQATPPVAADEAVATVRRGAVAAPSVAMPAVAAIGRSPARSTHAVGEGAAAPSPAAATVAIESVPALQPLWIRALPWMIALWMAGALTVLTPMIVGLFRLTWLRRAAHPVRGGRWALLIPSALREIGVRRRVRFLELESAVMPMTWGVVRPVVLLPAGDFDSTIPQRLDVLRHELAHVRRFDCLTQLVARLSCAVLWFNPLAWVAARQLRIERERACDDEVLRAGAKPSDYAGYLLRVARSMRVPGAAAYGGLAMARPSQLAGRLLAVLDDERPRARLSSAAATRFAGVATAVVVAIASLSPAAASAGNESPAKSELPLHAVPIVAHSTEATVPLAAPEPSVDARVPSHVVPAIAVSPPVDAPRIASLAGVARPVAASALEGRLGAASLPALAVFTAPCERATRSGKRSTSTNSTTSRDGTKQWRVIWREGDCAYEIDARGEITYNRDVTDVESISRGGSFAIEQDDDGETRRLEIRPRSDGTLERQYSVNGDSRPYDADARAWLAGALIALDRQTAFAADQRVPAILDRGGVNAVFQEISLLGSDYARRRYYTKLLSMRSLDRAQVRRVVEQAGTEMESDYELAELLIAASKLDAFGDDSHMAFVSASRTIGSDYERRRTLNALLRRDQLAPSTVQALLEAASTIGSDYELAELLIDVAKRYAVDEQTRPVYIKAVGSIGSDYEHRRVLSTIMASGELSAPVTRALLEDARRIDSDYELAEFLVQVAKKGTLDATTRESYFAAADKIKSDYEHRRALSPLVKRDILTRELAKAVLESAAKIRSDYECASLLVEVANAIAIDEELRPAFERAADTIQGEHEYGRAMSAARRRVTR